MRGIRIFVCFCLLGVTSSAWAQSDIWQAHPKAFVEPFSPILGSQLLDEIFSSDLSPNLIYEEFLLRGELVQIENRAIAYYSALLPGLKKYCSLSSYKTTPNEDSRWTHHSAIPTRELNSEFQEKYVDSFKRASALSETERKAVRKELGRIIDSNRRACPSVMRRLWQLIQVLEGVCASKTSPTCFSYLNSNLKILAMEAPYPRTQYSINGFTRYFIQEVGLTSNLKEKLDRLYRRSSDYLKMLQRKEQSPRSWWEAMVVDFEDPRELILLLSGLTRNMPSLDYFYAQDPAKALLVEVYFWKLKVMREKIESLSGKLYPVEVFSKDKSPGVYHFYTAALQGCDLTRQGFVSGLAVAGSFIQKVSYKGHKLLKGFTSLKSSELQELLKTQGTLLGIQGGVEGGFFGASQCLVYSGRKIKSPDPLWIFLKEVQWILRRLI